MTGALVTKTVSFDELVCAPLLRESRFLSNIDEVRIGEGPAVHVGKVEDVLYLPDRRLQIVRDRFVPLEATPYQGALAYVQTASMTDGKGRYEYPIGCREVDEEVCILANIWSYNPYHWIENCSKRLYWKHMASRVDISCPGCLTLAPNFWKCWAYRQSVS